MKQVVYKTLKTGLLPFAVMTVCFAEAPPRQGDYRAHEDGNKLVITTPFGEKSYQADFNLGAMKHYRIEIPLADMKPADVPPTAEAPAGLPGTPESASSAQTDPAMMRSPASIAPMPYPVYPYPQAQQVDSLRQPSAPDLNYDNTERLILEANHFYNRGKYYEAMHFVEELIRKHPRMVRAWVMKGSLLYMQGYRDLAQKSWEQALRIEPANPEVRDLMKRYP